MTRRHPDPELLSRYLIPIQATEIEVLGVAGGSSQAVFSAKLIFPTDTQQDRDLDRRYVVKIGRNSSINQELQTLSYLKQKNKDMYSEHVEQLQGWCASTDKVGMNQVSKTDMNILLKQPVLGHDTNNGSASKFSIVQSIADIQSLDAQKTAVSDLIQAFVFLLESGVSLSDVQMLFDSDTGYGLMIDLSETYVLPSWKSYQDWSQNGLYLSALIQFISEISAMIPDDNNSSNSSVLTDIARHSLEDYFESTPMSQIPNAVREILFSVF